MRWPCDRPERIGARIFVALRTDCPCCLFWRGAIVGAALTCVFILGAVYVYCGAGA